MSVTLIPTIDYFFRPLRGSAAGVIVVFTVLLTLAVHAGLFGIPLALILTSWFFKYAYIFFDHNVWGYKEPPHLDIQLLNPLDEQRPLAQCVIFGLLFAGVSGVRTWIGPTAAAVLAAASILLIPASIAVLGLERNILKAANPVLLVRMVRGLGPSYLTVLVFIALIGVGVGLLARVEVWLPLEIAVGQFAILAVFSVLGGALYERRAELELEAWHSPERAAGRAAVQEAKTNEAIVTEAYGLMRARSHGDAWNVLRDWLASRGNAPQDYHWLIARLERWHDARYVTRMTEEYIERLMTLKQTGEALDVLTHRLDLDAQFRPKSATATFTLAQLSVQGGGRARIARVLLSDFEQRFPGDPSVSAARRFATQLGAE